MKHIVYQVLPRLWGNGRFSAWNAASFRYLSSLGVDCIWFTGVPRHASGKPFVKGNPGCPYSISDWKDVNPYLADDPDNRMDEFEALVERCHKAGFKVLVDYIPNHVACDYEGDIRHFDYCDGDWTDTLKNDWSDPRTFEAMLDILSFWVSKGVDGFRCDMVELVPADALRGLIAALKSENPDLLFVAEVYGKENYPLYSETVGFDLLYDKSGMYDSLRAICCDGHTARSLTWNWQWLGPLQPRMINFLENHDEQRAASPEFLGSASRGYAALAASLLFNTASFLLYFGQEVGENAAEGCQGRTSIFNWCRPASIGRLVDSIESGKRLPKAEAEVLRRYRELLGYAGIDAFSRGNVWDLCYCNYGSRGFDADRHFAFLRYDEGSAWLVVCNFSDIPAEMDIVIPAEVQPACACTGRAVCVDPWDAAVVRLK